MLRWAKTSPFFRCVHLRAGVILARGPLSGACFRPFASKASRHGDSLAQHSASKNRGSLRNSASKASRHGDSLAQHSASKNRGSLRDSASKASRHDAVVGSLVQLSASKVSRNHGNASVSASKPQRRSAHDTSEDVNLSVHNAGRQDIDVACDVRALPCSHHDAKSHSVNADAKVFEGNEYMPHAKMQVGYGDGKEAESVASPNDNSIPASSSTSNDNCLPGNVVNAPCEMQSPRMSLQTLLEQMQERTCELSSDLQQKIDLLELEQFSISDAAKLFKRRAFKACTVKQLAATLQVLKKSFASVKTVHDILVGSSNVLLQPAELVQQKRKLLYDFQLEEKVVSKLCGRGRALSISLGTLQERLMFYNDIGLTVGARNKIFGKAPLILTLTIENCIQPTLEFLKSMGLTKERSLKLVEYCPDILYMSVDKNLMKKYEYFDRLGFSPIDFPKVVRSARRFSIKQMEEHVQFLNTLGFTDDDVRLMLKRQPEVLALGSDSLKHKVDFLICKQNRNLAEIVKYPKCLMYSLQARTIPRFNFVNELGLSKVYPLSSILNRPDSIFMKRFAKASKLLHQKSKKQEEPLHL